MELKIEYVCDDNFTVMDELHNCYLNNNGEQVIEPYYLKSYEVLEVVKFHIEAQSS